MKPPNSLRLVERMVKPFEEFAQVEASGGILLLVGTLVALMMANSPWAESYSAFWQTQVGVSPEWFGLARPLSFWINDGLMTVFFLVVGLEIKRELMAGELASPRRAALPAVAALGGMVVPALLYLSLNFGAAGERGWGVPMATDIAFTVGVIALLGRWVPLGLKVFVTALAIADDIGAVLVIAVFYSAALAWLQLAAAGAVLLLLVLANRLGIRSILVYGLLGVGLWVALLESGVHTTIAGGLLAAAIPARTRIDPDEFVSRGTALLTSFAKASAPGSGRLASAEQLDALQGLEAACERAATPLHRLERLLHPWAAFAIMPLFALANAGVSLAGPERGGGSLRVTLGVALGLILGKPIGITLFSWVAVRLRWAAKPADVSWPQMLGGGCLCGIGFTMSLFIACLAFGESGALDAAKLGILTASIVAGIVGAVLLRRRPSGHHH